MKSSLFFPWILIEVPDGMEHEVVRKGTVGGHGAALGVDVVAEASDLTEEVVAAKLQEPLALADGLRERGIPIETVVVQLCVGITSAGVHGEVGLNSKIPRQLIVAVQSIVDVSYVGGLLARVILRWILR